VCRIVERSLVNQRIHPQTIIRGWGKAIIVARSNLDRCLMDHGKDSVAFREDLLNIARTTLSSKILARKKNYFAELAVEELLRLKGSTDLSSTQIVKKVGGSLNDSFILRGWICTG
jgi:T-complex protein 1 subunit beta